eukprot:UN24292
MLLKNHIWKIILIFKTFLVVFCQAFNEFFSAKQAIFSKNRCSGSQIEIFIMKSVSEDQCE